MANDNGFPEGHWFFKSVPVNAERAQAQHGDSDRGLLDEGDQFAQGESEGPIFCHQLQHQPKKVSNNQEMN